MAFNFPELTIESILRIGLAALADDDSLINDIFTDSLKSTYNQAKYGDKDLAAIKTLIQRRNIGIVHSWNQINSSIPCISLQLQDESENIQQAHLDDFEDDLQEDITDPDELDALTKVSNVIITAYDSLSGTCTVDDTVDLSSVYKNMIFVDSTDTEFSIIGGINNLTGHKQFLVVAGSEVTTGTGYIRSSIDFTQFELRGIKTNVSIIVGIHTGDALLTKYLYLLVKFLILSHKKEIDENKFFNLSFRGSDFLRDAQYHGDNIYTRFLTISGVVEDNWSSDQVIPIERAEVIIQVAKDIATNEDLEKTESTIQIDNDVDQDDL